jgi:hypothetical protein
MLGEQSLIKTENQISGLIPEHFRRELVIVCGPIGEFLLTTVHMVRQIGESREVENVTFWRQFVPDATFSHLGKEYQAIDSVMMRHKYRNQSVLLTKLKSLQMLLSAIATNLAVEEEERAAQAND